MNLCQLQQSRRRPPTLSPLGGCDGGAGVSLFGGGVSLNVGRGVRSVVGRDGGYGIGLVRGHDWGFGAGVSREGGDRTGGGRRLQGQERSHHADQGQRRRLQAAHELGSGAEHFGRAG